MGPFSTGTWYHVAGVLTGNTVTLYVNGSAAGTTTATKAGTLLDTAQSLSIGNGDSLGAGTDGILDEVRLSSTARSPGWLLTQYRNVSSPPTFYELDADVMQVRSGTYVGNGSSQSISGLGFQPYYVMVTSVETWGCNTVVESRPPGRLPLVTTTHHHWSIDRPLPTDCTRRPPPDTRRPTTSTVAPRPRRTPTTA
jgi:hypothetical protein